MESLVASNQFWIAKVRLFSTVHRVRERLIGPNTPPTNWLQFSAFGKLYEALDAKEQSVILGEGNNAGLVRLCCFHPAYGYEDFLEGYRPKIVNEQVAFERRDGVFKVPLQRCPQLS